jgi:hypothetical protein
MSAQIRIERRVYEEVRSDLARPHKVAHERIGFLSASVGNQAGDQKVILLHDYVPVADSNYVRDHLVGARINSDAIRMAMQKIMDTKKGLFHVHAHPGTGKPFFSKTDLNQQPKLLGDFLKVGQNFVHGLFLLSQDSCTALVLLPGTSSLYEVSSISIVGFPFEKIT